MRKFGSKYFLRVLGTILAIGGVFTVPTVNSVAKNVERLGVGLLTLPARPELTRRESNDSEEAADYKAKYQLNFEQITFHPLSAEKIWQKAIKIEAAQPVKAITLAQLATIVSKRHTSSHLWKLEHAIVKEDTEEVLSQYDVLISAASPVGPTLVSLLSAAVAEDYDIRNLLLAFSHRPWFKNVVIAAIAQTNGEFFEDHISETAKFLPPKQQQDIYQIYLNQLSEQNNLSAINKFVKIHREIPKSIIYDFSINKITTDNCWGSLAWEIPQTQTTSVFWDKNKEKVKINGKFDISTLILKRTVFLRNSDRKISFHLNIISGSIGRMRSLIQCKGNRNEAFWTEFTRAAEDKKFQHEVSLPDNCHAQSFQLYLTSKSDQTFIAEFRNLKTESADALGQS